MPDREDRFPARDGIRADDWVGGAEGLADVFRATARIGVELEGAGGGCLVKLGLSVGRREGFEELLVGAGDAVVELVARGPERVCDEAELEGPVEEVMSKVGVEKRDIA